LGKGISICILVTIAFLALLLSFSSGSVARAQTQTNTSGSTTYSTPSTSTSVTSNLTGFASTHSRKITVTTTSTTTTVTTLGTSTSSTSGAGYSLSFSPVYWLCTDVLVTFTGPLVESGFYGDTLQFQYFQYTPTYPSLLTPIFTDPGLTVTSDTVNYWINYIEYAQVNFAYQPNIAVKVVDVTLKSNGYMPGLIFMQLTNIRPEGGQYCRYDVATATPEFQAEWLMIMASVVLSLLFLRVHKHYRSPEKDSRRTERNRNLPRTAQ